MNAHEQFLNRVYMCWCLAPSCVDDVSCSYLIIASEKTDATDCTSFQCFLMLAKWQVSVVLLLFYVQATATVLENKKPALEIKSSPLHLYSCLILFFVSLPPQ